MHMVFRVGRTQYAVESRRVRALVLAEVPAAGTTEHPHFRGAIVLARRNVPVVDLGSALGLVRKTPAGAAVLVVEAGGRNQALAGLLVDEILDVVAIDGASVRAPPANEAEAAYATGLARTNERVVSLLDLDRILALTP